MINEMFKGELRSRYGNKIEEILKDILTKDIYDMAHLLTLGSMELHNVLVNDTYQNGDCGIWIGNLSFSQDNGNSYNCLSKIKNFDNILISVSKRIFFNDENIEGGINLNKYYLIKDNFQFNKEDDADVIVFTKNIAEKTGLKELKLYKIVRETLTGYDTSYYIKDKFYCLVCSFKELLNVTTDKVFLKSITQTINDYTDSSIEYTDINEDNLDDYLASIKILNY